MIRLGIQFILALAAWNCLAQIPGWSPVELSRVQRVADSAPEAFTPYTAGFDGANDSMAMNGGPTGFAAAKTLTFSVWLDFTGGDGSQQYIYWSVNDKFSVQKTTGNAIRVIGKSSGGTTLLDATSSVTKTASDGWFHLLICIDLDNASNRHFYFDGTDDASVTWTTYANTANIQFDNTDSPARRVGAGSSALAKLNASACELYLSNRYLNDVSKFRDSGTGKPISLGSDGSTPDGSKPGFYFSRNGSGDSWIVDSANANSFTLTGALGSPAAP